MDKEFLLRLSAKEIREMADAQHDNLRLTCKTEAQFNQKVLKVKNDMKVFMKSENNKYIEMSDLEEVANVTRNIHNLGLSIMIPSFVIATYSKKIPFIRRLPTNYHGLLRVFMLFGPIGGIYSYSISKNDKLSAYFEYKYAYRVQRFNITKDPKDINPNYENPSTPE